MGTSQLAGTWNDLSTTWSWVRDVWGDLCCVPPSVWKGSLWMVTFYNAIIIIVYCYYYYYSLSSWLHRLLLQMVCYSPCSAEGFRKTAILLSSHLERYWSGSTENAQKCKKKKKSLQMPLWFNLCPKFPFVFALWFPIHCPNYGGSTRMLYVLFRIGLHSVEKGTVLQLGDS